MRWALLHRQETEVALKYRRLEILAQLVSVKIVTLHRHEQLADSTTLEHKVERLKGVEKALQSSSSVVETQIKDLKGVNADLRDQRDRSIAKV